MIELHSMINDHFFQVVKICASQPRVHQDVLANHEDNQWWPLAIGDWRLRLVVAGWSTRLSYHMISTYQRVISQANAFGYDRLSAMQDNELRSLTAPLGLAHSRVGYFRAVQSFIDRSGMVKETLLGTENDTLIELLAKNVKGAGYKVAQCAILYAKGYHCGIFPVDSGMKDMLGPCMGLKLPRGTIAHDVMRKQIEHLLHARSNDYYLLAHQLGYGQLNIPKDRAPIWWAHLVLIYFKRRYCNKHAPHACPLRGDQSIGMHIGSMCNHLYPQRGTLTHSN